MIPLYQSMQRHLTAYVQCIAAYVRSVEASYSHPWVMREEGVMREERRLREEGMMGGGGDEGDEWVMGGGNDDMTILI